MNTISNKCVRMSNLEKDGLISLSREESYPTCKSCILGKMAKSPFNRHLEKATKVLELVHIVVCRPFNEMAKWGFYYFISFTNNYSRYGSVYLMKYTHESFGKFTEFKS